MLVHSLIKHSDFHCLVHGGAATACANAFHRGLRRSEMADGGLYILMLVFLFLLISCWLVTASLMAENTNVALAVIVADNASMCGFGSDVVLSVCSLVRCCSHQFVFAVLRCCFRALLHVVRSAAGPSQDILSMSTAFIYLMQTSLCRR